MTDYTDQGIDPESGLKLKERLFADLYLVHLSATRAYREAGYAASNYPNARKDASELLNGPHIRSYLDQRMKERNERLSVSADRTLKELVVIGYSRIDHFQVNQNTGRLEVLPGVPEEALGAVRSCDVSSRTETEERDGKQVQVTYWRAKIVLWDKLKALHTLCLHLGLISTELPPLEVLFARLPPNVAAILRRLLAAPPGQRPADRPRSLGDGPG